MANDKIIDWIKDCKVKGYDDNQIKGYLKQQGYADDKIKSLILQAAARRFSRPFLVGIYLGSFIVIIMLIIVGIYAVKTINVIYEEEYTKDPMSFSDQAPVNKPVPAATATPTPTAAGANNIAGGTTNKDLRINSALKFCVNESYHSFLSFNSQLKPNITLEQNSGEMISFPGYDLKLPKDFAIQSLNKQITNQMKNCLYKQVRFEPRSATVNISVVGKSFSIDVTIIDYTAAKYSANVIETLG
jgi:hypothetical protein